MEKCKDNLNIKCVYFINPKDCIYDKDGNMVRMKRKYGKFDRKIDRLDY